MREPLRVAWFGHASGTRADGLSTYSSEVVSALSARGVRVAFFSHEHDGDVAPAAPHVQLEARRFKTVVLPHRHSADTIAEALERFRPHVMHISLSFSLLDGWLVRHARRHQTPIIATVHLPYAGDGTLRNLVLEQLYRFHAPALRQCDALVALSGAQRALLARFGCDADRIVVLPNAVDTDRFSPGPSRLRQHLRAEFVVAYLGRIDPEKRVASLVRAFASLRWPDDHVLVIAGSGSREREVRELASALPNVRVLGALRDQQACADLLRAADVFVLPSTAEGLSLAMLEAMAAGCAVVATDVAEDGAALRDAGLIVPVTPIEPAVRDALRTLRSDDALRLRLREAARARAVERFSLQRRIERLLQLYEDVRGRGAAAA